MKRILRVVLMGLFSVFIALISYGQTSIVAGDWTWMGGANTAYQTTVYGTKGVSAATNVPGARSGAMKWKDSQGNFWLMGGVTSSQSYQDYQYLNDLWKYNPSTGQWTWMSGSNAPNQLGIYISKGQASSGIPGARLNAVTWADTQGNLWLMGGSYSTVSGVNSTGYLYNDLWKYNISTGLWTWVGGSSTANQQGVYGTKGVAAATNVPGARCAATSWIDVSGNLWLMGGNNGTSFYNDLWKYNITSGQWTWMSGSNIPNQYDTFGTQGVPAPNNIPGARDYASGWADKQGNLWLFGGEVLIDYGGYGLSNALWKYNIASAQWTWISGGYGDITTQPVPRYAALNWIDASDNLWLMGGNINSNTVGISADLWKFNTSLGTWTNVKNFDNTGTNYGAKGVAAISNSPGARSNSVSWADAAGNLWLMGGISYNLGINNDLWVYKPNPITPPVTQASALTFPRISATQADINWTNGDGESRAVFISATTTGSPVPVSGVTYSANSYFGTSSQIGSTGWYCIYNGTGSLATVTGLKRGTKYRVATIEYNGSPGSQRYATGTIAGNPANFSTSNAPTVPASNIRFTATTATQTIVNWTNGSGTARVVLISPANALIPNAAMPTLRDSVNYGADGRYGKGSLIGGYSYSVSSKGGLYSGNIYYYTVYNGSDSSTTITGLSPNTDYRVTVMEYNGTSVDGYTGNEQYINLTGTGDAANVLTMPTAPIIPDIKAGQWTWINGSQSINQSGNYDSKGTASLANIPASRSGAFSWVDASDNLWLMGGNGAAGNLDDLWKFNISSGLWTWVGNSNTINAIASYGTKGIASPSNMPGARSGAAKWIDTDGNIWLMGGNGLDINGSSGYLNDLWKYDISTSMWTWISGSNLKSQIGAYGTKGVASTSNIPGSRSDALTWVDTQGNLWLMGGYGNGTLNDLWKYNITAGQWTWVSGSNTYNQRGIYGKKGLADANNVPGSRSGSYTWTDNQGNLWLMGGYGLGSPTSLYFASLNDLWKFNIISGLWTWMSGSDITLSADSYGPKGIASVQSIPGAGSKSVSWKDAAGDFWIMGGGGSYVNYANGNYNEGTRVILWKYSISSGLWTWFNGDNTNFYTYNYGTQGASSAANFPGLHTGASSWTDTSGNMWLFGGLGFDALTYNNPQGLKNDLWVYKPGESPTSNLPVTQAKDVRFTTGNVSGQEIINWTNGSGTGRTVFIAAANTDTPAPKSGISYNANVTYGFGAEIDNTGWYSIYDGTGSTVTVSGLTPGTTYRVAVNEYNVTAGSKDYNTSISNNNPANVLAILIKSTQVITFPILLSKSYGDPDFKLNASSNNASVPITYTSSDQTVATIVNGSIHILGSGTTIITATQNGNSTYSDATPISQTLTITKAKPTVTFGALTSQPYLTADFALNANSTNTTAPLTYTSSNTAVATMVDNKVHIIGAGTTTITATQAESALYQAASTSQVFTVTKATPTLSRKLTTIGYGSADFSPTASSNIETPIVYTTTTPDLVSIVNGKVHIIKTGLAVITASQPESNNFNAAANFTQYVNITKGTLVITAEDISRAYGAANPEFTFSYTGLAAGETADVLTTKPLGKTNALVTSPVGTYSIAPYGAVAANYNITYVSGVFTVTKAPLTATVNNVSRAYGAANPVVSYTYSGFVNGNTATVVSRPPVAAFDATITSDVGTYAINASGGTATNYDITCVPGTLTITPAPLVITAHAATKTYGAAAKVLAVSYGGFKNSQTAAALSSAPVITSDGNTPQAAAGTYPISVSGAASANYTITYVPAILTVSKATLRIIAANKTKAYGAEIPAFTATASGWLNGDLLPVTPTYACTATSASDVGSYTITPSGVTLDNYNITYVAGKLTVNKAPLTITAANYSRAAMEPNPPAFNITYSGFVLRQDESVLTALPVATGSTTTVLGKYPITVSGAVAGNYSFIYKSGVLTITKQVITASAGSDAGKNSLSEDVPVTTLAEALTVHQAISPNGDGINDFLLIEGIENYPDNRVTIMSQNGATVYQASGYDNGARRFDGHSNKGALQRAGTYFYLINYSDKGEEKRKVGFLVIKDR